ncbi:N-acetyltransferase [Clostridium sp. D33t1_170424_F3]|uniref:GNAT family N-acetyltransferase n=1 Tax=Clostridium sp. D33t1_170424_F3 TaxID=2787099 RepID=UPI0018A9A2D6|nr:N-acetyltransferase [Clostridium sp. D33t1_170424_F3]
MLIRQETEKDYDEVYDLIKEAFATAEHRDGTEQDLAAALRKSPAFIKELSLVAEVDGRLAGQILFTEAKVGTEPVLVLAPLSVRPAFQKSGVGTALINEAHKIAAEAGYSYSFVLGSEFYYPRFGYLPAAQFGVEVPAGMPSANFMAVRLSEDAKPLSGTITYAKEFGI